MDFLRIPRAAFSTLFFLSVPLAVAEEKTPVAPYATSWLGNSLGNGNGKYMQQNLSGIWVREDGTVFTIAQYDEGHQSGGIYRDGDLVGQLKDTVLVGGRVITGDAEHLWVSIEGIVRRYQQNGDPAPYADGDPSWVIGDGQPYIVRGLAVVGDELFVSDKNGLIRVYDKRDKKALRSWKMSRPGKIAADKDGTLWIVQRKEGGQPASVRHFTTNGKALDSRITDTADWDPTGLCFDREGHLLVADDGPDQQVKIYLSPKDSPTVPDATFGERGGILGGVRGKVAPRKFNGPVDVGVDAKGNIYVAQDRFGQNLGVQGHGAGAILQSYRADGTLNWDLHSLEFVDGADVDRSSVSGNEMDVYTKLSRYHVDLSRRTAGAEGVYAGHTLDRFRYPNDPRLRRQPQNGDFTYTAFVRTLAGQKFVFNTGMWSRFLEVYRFSPETDGEIAIPCVVFNKQADDGYGAYVNNPTDGQWIWTDSNGNGNMDACEFVSEVGQQPNIWGWWVDSTGAIWRTIENRIEKLPFQGISEKGVPQWSFATREIKPTPKLFAGPNGNMRRIEVFPDLGEGVAFISGYEAWPGADEKALGIKLACYDKWNTPQPVLRWSTDIPWSRTVTTDIPEGMSVAGDYLFIVYSGFSTNGKESQIRVYKTIDGTYAGRIVPGPEVGDRSGTADIPYGIRAYRHSDKEYLIFVEEDNFGKVLMYRWNSEVPLAK